MADPARRSLLELANSPRRAMDEERSTRLNPPRKGAGGATKWGPKLQLVFRIIRYRVQPQIGLAERSNGCPGLSLNAKTFNSKCPNALGQS